MVEPCNALTLDELADLLSEAEAHATRLRAQGSWEHKEKLVAAYLLSMISLKIEWR